MKYAVYTKWQWSDCVPDPSHLQSMMRGYRDNYGGEFPPEEVLWWKIDDKHHQAVIVYPSEGVANAERSKLEEARSKTSQDNNNVMVEEFVGPIVMQLTAL
jgi:hypothetical protein